MELPLVKTSNFLAPYNEICLPFYSTFSRYCLFAVVNHSGTIETGHYTGKTGFRNKKHYIENSNIFNFNKF